MPTRNNTFEIRSTVSRVEVAVKHALAELGWESESEGETIVTREDATRLCCSMSPVKATIELTDIGASTTRIAIDVSVPGFGPGPKRQLADRCAGLEQRIRRWEASLAARTSVA